MSNDDWDSKKDPARSKRSASSEITDAVLKSLKPRAGKGTTKWLAEVTQEAMEEPSAPSLQARQEPPPQPAVDMMTMVDKLFDFFTGYTFELNRSVGSRDLNVDIERPTLRKGGDPRSGHRAAFCGRLFMRKWSLMIRGEEERIEGSVVPSDQILAYNAYRSQFATFFAIELSINDAVPVWKLDGVVLQVDDLRTPAKQLILSLVRFAKGELSQGDQFVWAGSLETAAGRTSDSDTPISVSQIPARPASFYSDHESSLFSSISGPLPPRPEQLSAPTAENRQQSSEVALRTSSVPSALGLLEEAVSKELEKLSRA